MTDALDELAAKLMDDAADTTEKVRTLAKSANLSADEALSWLVGIFRNSAQSRRDPTSSDKRP